MAALENHHSIVGINVKSYGRLDLPEDLREREGFEGVAERAWEEAVEMFWHDAQYIARELGFLNIEQHGRMGGWAVPTLGDLTIQRSTGDYLRDRARSLTEEEINDERLECPECCFYTGEPEADCETCKGSGTVPNPWRERFADLKIALAELQSECEAGIGANVAEHYAEVDREIERVAYWNARDIETVS